MKKLIYLISAFAAVSLCGFIYNKHANSLQAQLPSPALQTKAIALAANAFLKSLNADQRKIAQLEFLRPKVASPVQFNMSNMRRGPGGPPNGRPPRNGDSTQRGANNNGQRPNGGGPAGGPPASGEQYGKAIWSNFPVSITPRAGIELGSLTASQRAAAITFVTACLKRRRVREGYRDNGV